MPAIYNGLGTPSPSKVASDRILVDHDGISAVLSLDGLFNGRNRYTGLDSTDAPVVMLWGDPDWRFTVGGDLFEASGTDVQFPWLALWGLITVTKL